MMRVGIDITSLIYDRGVSRYTKNLVEALVNSNKVTLSLYGSCYRQKNLLEQKAKRLIKKGIFKPHQIVIQGYPPSIQNLLWRLGLNSIKKIMPDIQVFHSWDWLQPPDKNIPLVSTIHDLAILKYENISHQKVKEMHQQSWRVLQERNAQIIAVSQATKRDVIELLGIPSYKITVIPEALPQEIRQTMNNLTEPQYDLIKAKLKLNRPFLLFVGTREPRKNLVKLIEAWLPFQSQLDLIIAGEKGWDQTDKIKQTNLRLLGKVSEPELAVLYEEAEALVYPSLYEGFGLPILESFFHGTPVITSNIPALVEVAGNAAELIDPNQVESIRQGIEKILSENQEDQQKRLQRMIIRLQMFSWDRVANETIKVYDKAVQEFNQ